MEIPKELEQLILRDANLEKDGLDAFRTGDFTRCIELMNRVLDRQKNNWQARLYLAMSHYSVGDIYTGAIHFRYLEEKCPDKHIQTKAKSALKAIDSKTEPPDSNQESSAS